MTGRKEDQLVFERMDEHAEQVTVEPVEIGETWIRRGGTSRGKTGQWVHLRLLGTKELAGFTERKRK